MKKDTEQLRVARVRQLFTTHYPDLEKRNGNDVFAFFGWLQGHYPELLPQPAHGDPYQFLKSDLHGLYKD